MKATIHHEKRDTTLTLLDRGLVMVHLDPRVEGVVVPEHLAEDPTLRLNIAYGFNLPALEIDDEGIYAVLSFGGVNHGCTLPWESIYALTLPGDEHDGKVWASSLPPELAEQAGAMAEAAEEAARAPTLRVVEVDEDAATDIEASDDTPGPDQETTPSSPDDRPSLRLVTD
jgi:stringent starvation protein B